MRDYLVIAALDATQDAARLMVRDRLVASGAWRAVAERKHLCVLLETAAPPAYRHLPGVAGALIGDVFDASSARDGFGEDFCSQSLAGLTPREAALKLSYSAFGRYLAVFTDGPAPLVYRDPMGVVEALSWKRDGLGFVASRLPEDRALWPHDIAIDWTAVAKILRQKTLAHHLSPLLGVRSIEPGVLTTPWPCGTGNRDDERLWAPAW
jgi:asparagine synthase (glutamine-hydrolysing)